MSINFHILTPLRINDKVGNYMNNPQHSAILKALFSVTVWGASFVATKIALQYATPITVVWVRFAMGVVILGLAVKLRGQFALPQGKDWGYFALLGFLGITFHQWLQSTGLVTAQATTTGWIIASTPIFMALLGVFVLKENLNWGQAAGIGLATIGVLLVITKGDLSALANGKFGTKGDLLVLLSAPNWAVFSALSRSGLRRHHATHMMFYIMTFGWLFSSFLYFATPSVKPLLEIPVNGWIALTFLGIFCSGFAYIFWYDALQALPVAQTGAFLYIEPIITVIVAAIVLHERLLLATIIGGITILIGVWMVNRTKSAPHLDETEA